MNLNKAREMCNKNLIVSAEIQPSPTKAGGWFLMLLDDTGKSFLLVDEQEEVVARPSVDEIVQFARAIGLRTVSIRLG